MQLVFGLHFTLEHSVEFDLFLLSYKCDALFFIKYFLYLQCYLRFSSFRLFVLCKVSVLCVFSSSSLDFYHKSKISCWSHAYAGRTQLLDIICCCMKRSLVNNLFSVVSVFSFLSVFSERFA